MNVSLKICKLMNWENEIHLEELSEPVSAVYIQLAGQMPLLIQTRISLPV